MSISKFMNAIDTVTRWVIGEPEPAKSDWKKGKKHSTGQKPKIKLLRKSK